MVKGKGVTDASTTAATAVVEGPDLNASRSPFDKKIYRQILLPNGLRAVLVSDVVAMTQAYNLGGILDDFSDDDDDSDCMDVDEAKSEGGETSGSLSESYDEGEKEEAGGLRNAAAAMVVGVGSLYDPKECQGMAHFLEHLLFMGSEKYPEENCYDAYMSKHGGSDNAYTENEHTVFHFEIPQEQLSGALDLFAQFFVSPLLNESCVERELKAIESEFMLAKNSDSSRLQQLMAYTCGRSFEEHPASKFGWGNYHSLKTLPEKEGHDPLKMLRTFYDEHHYASNMRLAVVGGYPLDYLQEQVLKFFSDIKSKDPLGSYTWDQHYESPMKSYGLPMTESGLKKIFYVAPVRDRHSLSVTWQIPPQNVNWKAKPCDYLAHLIGHEAKGSLLAFLKSKSWASGLCAGVGDEGTENSTAYALFTVTINLSEEGVEHWRDVVTELYRYVGMLRHYCREEGGLPAWIYEELRSIYEVAHRYADEEPPEDFVVDLAEEMSPWFNTPPERLLDASGLLFDYDPGTVQNLLDNFFSPSNARIDLSSSQFGRSSKYEETNGSGSASVPPSVVDYYNNFDLEQNALPPSDELFDPAGAGPPHIEPIFGTPFWCQRLSASLLEEWTHRAEPGLPPSSSPLALPQRNGFVPTDFSLKPLPPADCDHPLLNCSIKLQIPVGKRKEWFPATVTQYNGTKNQILCAYEDEDEKWHRLDVPSSELKHGRLTSPDFEGSLDGKKIKYRIVSMALEGERASLKFGDESDWDVEDGKAFPAIPPKAPPDRLPKLVANTNELKLWHVQDRVFKRPIAELRLQLNCAEANKTALHAACADLLVNLVCDHLTEVTYMASVCEIGSSLCTNDGGLAMRVHGFSDKLMDLFVVLLETLLGFRNNDTGALPEGFCERRFGLVLENYRRSCHNSGMKAKAIASGVRIRSICRNGSYSARQKLEAIRTLGVPAFAEAASGLLARIGAEGLHTGNASSRDAVGAGEAVLRLLKASSPGSGGGLPRKKYPGRLVYKLPAGTTERTCVSKNPGESNAAVEFYLQVGRDDTRVRVLVDLLVELMNEPMYHQIRTRDQFGYSVACASRWTNGVIGLHLSVVSASRPVGEIRDRIDRFLRDFRFSLAEMAPEVFTGHMVGLAKEKLHMANSLAEETTDLWEEIRDGRYLWEAHREEVACLKTVTREEVLEAYDRYVSPDQGTARRLIVSVAASDGPASAGRPGVEFEAAGAHNDGCVESFHALCKNQTYGKIY
ncbi:unnamed protein product [Pseudo-nitzschia multistriata]|uniref:Peptidase M16 N-terminal domain-containing protein n=1 Tax=Pseudo-nitzschia multistriata TaxID=183589 RepID=A0A448YUW5_9STRA|nr:unnamed protein product [Pseudo-nitzschia multistriata]